MAWQWLQTQLKSGQLVGCHSKTELQSGRVGQETEQEQGLYQTLQIVCAPNQLDGNANGENVPVVIQVRIGMVAELCGNKID